MHSLVIGKNVRWLSFIWPTLCTQLSICREYVEINQRSSFQSFSTDGIQVLIQAVGIDVMSCISLTAAAAAVAAGDVFFRRLAHRLRLGLDRTWTWLLRFRWRIWRPGNWFHVCVFVDLIIVIVCDRITSLIHTTAIIIGYLLSTKK